MIVEEKKSAAINRIKELISLQNDLKQRYSEDTYNVFVFGSYPTLRYTPGQSDADIAVYTDSLEQYKEISLVIEDFFNERDIPVDLFFIDITTPAPVFLAPLHAQIQFTDYFPDELKRFENDCAAELAKIKRSIAV